MISKKYKVKAPGSCGELVQGMIYGKNFHVTCPVNLFSEITVSIFKNSDNSDIICINNDRKDNWKATVAMRKTLDYFGFNNPGGIIKIKSRIPSGKGMASSTADISGVILATALSLKEFISEDEIAKIALSIEPTDGIMFKDICLFDHKKGLLFERLGSISENKIIVIDAGGIVDTIEFNKKDNHKLLSENEEQINKTLVKLRGGFASNNINIIGECATESAILNQKILYKDYLDKLIELAFKYSASGVNIAHSGTVAGVILSPDITLKKDFYLDIFKIFKYYPKIYECKIINGGLIA